MHTEETDISADWKAESHLATELEKAKEELELISYVASHDLRAPMRTIAYTCEELEKNVAVVSDKAAKAGVQKIARETEHMKALLQGLLDYLRLETFGPSRAMLDMNEVVASALTILDEKIKSTGAKITCDPLPSFYGHRGRMTRLFVSLIDNALKFMGTQVPEIHISGKNNGRELEFCVEDNGIGIEEDYEDIIFVLFQRLHPETAYPGYGIGLALCKKIVESHGGRMWAESEVGKGSRFRFTLPVLQHS